MLPDAEQLIRDLVSAYIDHPAQLKIGSQESEDGAIEWAVECGERDQGKMIGYRGCHVRALALIIETMGNANRRTWILNLKDQGAPKRIDSVSRKAARHDPMYHVQLLSRVIAAIGLDKIETEAMPDGISPFGELSFRFYARTSFAEDYILDGENDRGETVRAAIDTLYRAIAKRCGVRYQLTFSR